MPPKRRRLFAESNCGRPLQGIDAAAARYCRMRVRSQQQLEEWLMRKRAAQAEADSAVRACRSLGLVDDAAAARLWAEHWARRGYSWFAIKARLRSRGIDGELIEPLAEVYGGPADEARARRLIKEMRLRRGSTAVRSVRRLAARGFDAEVIERALGEKRP